MTLNESSRAGKAQPIMSLTDEEIARINARAEEVGRKINCPLRFMQTPGKAHVALLVGTQVLGAPRALNDMAAHDIELELELLDSGARQIIEDDEGIFRLI